MDIYFYNRTIKVNNLRGSVIWACTWHGGKHTGISVPHLIDSLPEVQEIYNLSGKN